MNIFAGIEAVGRSTVGGPVASVDFRRIVALPRRRWMDAEDLVDVVRFLTNLLKTPAGRMALKVNQAAALRDLHDFGGLFGPIAVGGGKTLITLLAPLVMRAARPVLLVPAQLRDQTICYVLPEMKKHWKLHPGLRILGYSELSLTRNASLLFKLQPDMIIADECHLLKHPRSGRTRRVARYMKEYPHTTFVGVSGTVSNHSIMHYWHLIQWALKPDNAPVPRGYNEAREWANAIDERVRDEDRTGPGVLQTLESGSRGPPLVRARKGYRLRLVETPGVIATEEDRLGVSLQVTRRVPTTTMSHELASLMRRVENTWEMPDGEVIMEAVTLWRIMRELSCGFYYRWDPSPPKEWLEARRDWNSFVRQTLQSNRRGLDTPLQVWKEVEGGRGPGTAGVNRLAAWKRVKDVYKPSQKAVWVNHYLVQDAVQWLRQEPPGVCWVEHQAVGEELERLSGFQFYRAGDSSILKATRPSIASIAAHGTGKNLQQWHRALVVCPPTAGGVWEQLLGRLHRQGQLEDTVQYEVYQHTSAFIQAMKQAFKDARYLEQTLGNQQRLLYCDTDMRFADAGAEALT